MLPMSITYALLAVAVVLSAVCLIMAIWPHLISAWEKLGCTRARVLFLLAVTGAVQYGGSKHIIGRVEFPFTDVEQRYVHDMGSYVTNDLVHIEYTRVVAPATAPLFVDFREISSTNDADWVNLITTTFADFPSPQDLEIPNATNYNFVVYTTWTPGAAVLTNGVWHAYWGLDRKSGLHLIPVRTCVREDGEVLATPKSRWDNGWPITINFEESSTNTTEEANK